MLSSNEANTKVGVVYRVVCDNPGCNHTFELHIGPENSRVLGQTIACPRCGRGGGSLKPQGKIRDKYFSAKLVFRGPATDFAPSDDELNFYPSS